LAAGIAAGEVEPVRAQEVAVATAALVEALLPSKPPTPSTHWPPCFANHEQVAGWASPFLTQKKARFRRNAHIMVLNHLEADPPAESPHWPAMESALRDCNATKEEAAYVLCGLGAEAVEPRLEQLYALMDATKNGTIAWNSICAIFTTEPAGDDLQRARAASARWLEHKKYGACFSGLFPAGQGLPTD